MSTDETANGGSFKRGIHTKGFMEALNELAQNQESWWYEVLADPDLIIAIREEYLNVYWRGQSLFRVFYQGGQVQAKTHPKYLLDPDLETPVPFDGKDFALPNPSVFLMQTFQPRLTLRKMKTAARLYAGAEKEGVHEIVRCNPNVVDVEITLSRPNARLDERDLPRIDLASFEQNSENVHLVFWEAKLFSNGDLRAAGSGKPNALDQIEDYKKILIQQRSEVLSSYKQVAKNLVEIDAMRPVVRESSDLIKKVADGHVLLTMMDPPEVGLLVFGFDADQRDGLTWDPHKEKLLQALPQRVRAVGRPQNMRLRAGLKKHDLRAQLEGLARFVPIFTAPGFQFGSWHRLPPDPVGIVAFPSYSFSAKAQEFVLTACKLGWVRQLPWSAWINKPEAKALMKDAQRIPEATPDQLAKLLTVYIRGERFCDGRLQAGFESGALTAIVKRAEILLHAMPPKDGS